ncbi:hypothetical protein [Oceanisphaera sp. IT1-181]|uniref:hypothetical protein n=1 Tax=Oceanisphaera sp. IT1-181 TaxID=3081199 RepID=UPI0029CA65A4|nr:hypothetical protein [Oceanisphaera sp. IT1-181]
MRDPDLRQEDGIRDNPQNHSLPWVDKTKQTSQSNSFAAPEPAAQVFAAEARDYIRALCRYRRCCLVVGFGVMGWTWRWDSAARHFAKARDYRKATALLHHVNYGGVVGSSSSLLTLHPTPAIDKHRSWLGFVHQIRRWRISRLKHATTFVQYTDINAACVYRA